MRGTIYSHTNYINAWKCTRSQKPQRVHFKLSSVPFHFGEKKKKKKREKSSLEVHRTLIWHSVEVGSRSNKLVRPG